MGKALGLIETLGLTAAITALDAASKNADVILVGHEKVIGAGGAVSVTIQLEGDVAAVQSSVDAGVIAAKKIGKVLSYHVIPRPHEEVDILIDNFKRNMKKDSSNKNKTSQKKSNVKENKKDINDNK